MHSVCGVFAPPLIREAWPNRHEGGMVLVGGWGHGELRWAASAGQRGLRGWLGQRLRLLNFVEVMLLSNFRPYLIALGKLTKRLFLRNAKAAVDSMHGTSQRRAAFTFPTIQFIRLLNFVEVMLFSNFRPYLIARTQLTKCLFLRNAKCPVCSMHGTCKRTTACTLPTMHFIRLLIIVEVMLFSNFHPYLIALAQLIKRHFLRKYKSARGSMQETCKRTTACTFPSTQFTRLLNFEKVMLFSNFRPYLIALAQLTKCLFLRNAKSLVGLMHGTCKRTTACKYRTMHFIKLLIIMEVMLFSNFHLLQHWLN